MIVKQSSPNGVRAYVIDVEVRDGRSVASRYVGRREKRKLFPQSVMQGNGPDVITGLFSL